MVLALHYFPVTPLFMVLLFLAFAVLVAFFQIGVISYASKDRG